MKGDICWLTQFLRLRKCKRSLLRSYFVVVVCRFVKIASVVIRFNAVWSFLVLSSLVQSCLLTHVQSRRSLLRLLYQSIVEIAFEELKKFDGEIFQGVKKIPKLSNERVKCHSFQYPMFIKIRLVNIRCEKVNIITLQISRPVIFVT